MPRVPVPPVGGEQQMWSPPPNFGATRRERAGRGHTYRSAIPADISGLELRLPTELGADAEDAAAEIARFDASAEHGIGALTAVLLRSESASSSQIEQITASARAIAEAEVTGSGSANAVVVVDTMHAMAAAVAEPGPLTAERIADVQRVLLERHSPALVGWRTEPVWIGGGGSASVTADYVAPEYRHIAPALDDLIAFTARDDLPLLPQIAVAHAQFETIHPFADGNGRTGRALVQILLRRKQLTRTATLPISGGLLVAKDGYFAALDAYRRGDAGPIIEEFVRAGLRSVHQGQELSNRIGELRERWRQTMTARSDSAVWKVIDLLPAHPILDADTIALATGIHRNNVRRSLQPLIDSEILVGRQHFKSHKFLYRAPAILELLDDYAADVGRRQR